jgi:hypothetical protein
MQIMQRLRLSLRCRLLAPVNAPCITCNALPFSLSLSYDTHTHSLSISLSRARRRCYPCSEVMHSTSVNSTFVCITRPSELRNIPESHWHTRCIELCTKPLQPYPSRLGAQFLQHNDVPFLFPCRIRMNPISIMCAAAMGGNECVQLRSLRDLASTHRCASCDMLSLRGDSVVRNLC